MAKINKVMNIKELSLSCGSKITIFQNVFKSYERQWFIDFAINSYYKIGRYSGPGTQMKLGCFFSSCFTEEEDKQFGFNEVPFIKELSKKYNRERSWINSTIPGSMYYTHTDYTIRKVSCDDENISLLFCVNEVWDKEHGGETMFYNKYGEKEIAVDFVPGQIVMFNSILAHKPAFSYGHFEPRFMYVCQYRLKGM